MQTVLAFLVALALLIAVHEYGHYRVAVACGVRVLRFSIGFGRPLLRWRARKPRPGQDTEFVIAMLPLGGYVKMLDEREAAVPPHEQPRAFNRQPLWARAAIVAAGPAANLLLAIALYAGVSWYGQDEAKPIIASPLAGSLAQQAGLQAGDEILSVHRLERAGETTDSLALDTAELDGLPIVSFDDLRWQMTQAALDGQDLALEVRPQGRLVAHRLVLPLGQLQAPEADAELFQRIGLLQPFMLARIGNVLPGSAAEKAGLREGDVVEQVDGRLIPDARELRRVIESAADQAQGHRMVWSVRRAGIVQTLEVAPDIVQTAEGRRIGRIGAYIGAAPAMQRVSRGVLDALQYGASRTWDVSWLSLKMMGRMLIGEASVKNLSGPLTIADYAGKSAELGLTQYLLFLALISVSLGVLNLLPLPVLDGGHLLYYLWEAATGRAVSDVWMERLQRGGIAVLLIMMSVALFNDFSRLLG